MLSCESTTPILIHALRVLMYLRAHATIRAWYCSMDVHSTFLVALPNLTQQIFATLLLQTPDLILDLDLARIRS